jgi:nucleolar GTP-binding protein
MFKIPKIETGEFYLQQSIKSMQENATKEREEISKRFKNIEKKKDKKPEDIRLDKRKDLELQKIRYLNESINRKLRKVMKSFPSFLKLDKIYLDLINTSGVPVNQVNISLDRLKFIINRADELTQNTEWKIKKSKTQNTIGFLFNKYLGKISSHFKKEKEIFEKLQKARNFINNLPTFEQIYTAAIAGYPNVGKSTLMKNITGSDVEIQNYPFTTKGLMFGYIVESNLKQVQLIDTPGLLGRHKNNSIEQRAQIVLHDYCDLIVFVIDFTTTCGYNADQQLSLFKNTAKLDKELVIYLSKKDLYDEEIEEILEENMKYLKKYKLFEDSMKLKDYLLEKSTKKFDIRKVGVIR